MTDDIATRKPRMEALLAKINAIEQKGTPVEFKLELDEMEPVEWYILADTEDSWIHVYEGERDIYVVYGKGTHSQECTEDEVIEIVRHWLKHGDFPENIE